MEGNFVFRGSGEQERMWSESWTYYGCAIPCRHHPDDENYKRGVTKRYIENDMYLGFRIYHRIGDGSERRERDFILLLIGHFITILLLFVHLRITFSFYFQGRVKRKDFDCSKGLTFTFIYLIYRVGGR